MSNYLTPSYLEADFNTFKEKLQTLMKNSNTFKDYNYEGANITMLLELFSYLSELNTYYLNKVSKNMFIDTTDVYETTSSLANLRGYQPKGYIAPIVDLKVTVLIDEETENVPAPGDQLYIPAFFPIDTGISVDEGNIIYTTTQSFTETIPLSASGSYSFNIKLKQGEIETLDYTGEDIINNNIFLPFHNFDCDTGNYNENPSIVLYVNGIPWERVENFISNDTQVNENNNVYKLEYNKYQQYSIRFSSNNNVPNPTDQIKIFILNTFGENGDIAANTITEWENVESVPVLENNEFEYVDNYFIKNITKDYGLSINLITIENEENSINSSNPETIEEIVNNSLGVLESQYRNVTASDYKSHLSSHYDIVTANAFGEKEINPGNTQEYNKVYLTVIPTHWDSSTITTRTENWITETPGVSGTIEIPESYNDSLLNDLKEYLSPRRYLNTYETFILPELVYFGFDIGIKIKRMYNFTSVKTDIENKLIYYFKDTNRNFNEIIDFKELHNYLLDLSITSPTDNFSNIRGVNNLIFRDILTYTPSISGNETYIYEPNEDLNYPQFITEEFDTDYENILRPIKLGYTQFPVLLIDVCSYINEV